MDSESAKVLTRRQLRTERSEDSVVFGLFVFVMVLLPDMSESVGIISVLFVLILSLVVMVVVVVERTAFVSAALWLAKRDRPLSRNAVLFG